MQLVRDLEKIAKKKGCTSGQVGMAWVKAQSGKPGMPTVIPIPGASHEDRVNENMVDVELSKDDLAEIDTLLKDAVVIGDRYGGPVAKLSNGDSISLEEYDKKNEGQ